MYKIDRYFPNFVDYDDKPEYHMVVNSLKRVELDKCEFLVGKQLVLSLAGTQYLITEVGSQWIIAIATPIDSTAAAK